MTRFEADTAVERMADGRFGAHLDDGWTTLRSPNGGYIAAVVLRAMQAEAGADRPVRSLTLHYLRPPAVGAVEVAVSVERTGRSLSTLTARLEQDGRPCVLALGAFAVDFPEPVAYADPPPAAPPADAVPPALRHPEMPAMAHRFEVRPAIGPRLFSGADEALSGGWIGFAEGDPPLDAPALAMLADAWMPTPFTRLEQPFNAPTIDLTIHFRAPDVLATGPVLGVWRSRFAHAGFFEEDGELWSSDGVLLAQSRQLALLT